MPLPSPATADGAIIGRLSARVNSKAMESKKLPEKPKVGMVRQVPTRSRMLDKVGTYYKRNHENPIALSDSLIGISSSRLLSHMKEVGIPKAFGRLSPHVVPMHREERNEFSESLSKGIGIAKSLLIMH